MENVVDIPNGGDVSAAATSDGFIAAVKVVEDVDLEFVPDFERLKKTVAGVQLVRDGEELPMIDVGATTASVELMDENPATGSHWYTVKVVGRDYDKRLGKAPFVSYASPFFVSTT